MLNGEIKKQSKGGLKVKKHKEILYYCDHCDYKASKKGYLKKHTKESNYLFEVIF